MEKNSVQVCNVCLTPSNNGERRVYVKAVCGGDEIHICTSCLPTVIHENADAVKTNAQVEASVNL